MKKKVGVTLTDLAKELDLSIYTVSRAINGLSGVSDKTRAHVLETADSLGYIPNANARDLRRGVHRSVTLLTAGMSNPYYLDLISGIESVFQARGENLLIADMAVNGRYEESSEQELLQQVMENRPGGIISTLALSDVSRKRLHDWRVPVVFVDSVPGDAAEDFSYVTTDNVDASAKLGDHLAHHHFKRWLLVIYPSVWNSRYVREEGLKAAAQACGAQIEVLECGNDQGSAKMQIDRYLRGHKELPDVVIAGNNPILLGLMKAFSQRRLSIPQDMALVAFDDFTWSDLISPGITLVAEDSYGIGSKAADHLLTLIEGEQEVYQSGEGSAESSKPIHQTMRASLRIRESCGCPAHTS
ncbi:LacI family transcriptional regulator [Bifidobacterium aemilianum]|uniref:LacI family transcriptional regulator n=1 Tax=Bifidobacterium aemilianum TaxID=2493120 RepID=A0A366K793_9BIFI|nr:LacI family DNA-binding transcriptional regulator [Bifidobacterium aemilianum]RBP97606.1 LacI family transcriptional regulator [Bifidobacterium aemilianum]